jgi:chromosomal replication initiation ATPase DnaA
MSYSSLDPQADRPAVAVPAHPDSRAAKRDLVVAVVAKHTGVSADAIMGPSRIHSIVVGRHLCFLILKERLGLNSSTLGHLFGRNHGTVILGIRSVQDLLDTEPPLRSMFRAICADPDLSTL